MKIIFVLLWSLPLWAKPFFKVEKETHQGKTWHRVRIEGPGALKICEQMGIKLKEAQPGTIHENAVASCLMSKEGPVFGFLAGPAGEISPLEAFGYR